jgi:hypothetical protein
LTAPSAADVAVTAIPSRVWQDQVERFDRGEVGGSVGFIGLVRGAGFREEVRLTHAPGWVKTFKQMAKTSKQKRDERISRAREKRKIMTKRELGKNKVKKRIKGRYTQKSKDGIKPGSKHLSPVHYIARRRQCRRFRHFLWKL